MNVLVTGSTGLVGSALIAFLRAQGHRVTRLVRPASRLQPTPDEPVVRWDPEAGMIEASGLEGHDAVVHLAGETLQGRWTAAKKARIRESRVRGTQLLCETLARLARPPRVVVVASAVGYYGDRRYETLTEDSPPGRGFLAEVCQAWEAATEPAAQAGLRVVRLRTGIVLSAAGGALRTMLLPFRLGLGGVIGNGTQYWSWIAIDDHVRAILHVIETESLQGPVHAVSPHPVTNYEFTKTLGRVLRRPTVLPVPSSVLRLVLGEVADELLLSSQRVLPTRLLASGFTFQFPDLESALRHVLGVPSRSAG
jgi:uncharacterized protein (TIGR01777 family)